MKLDEFLQTNYNYNPDVKNNIQTYIDQWKSWYKGNVKDFHNYFIYNGNRKLKQSRYTMNMAKSISEDWSDILWSEKCKISLENEETQKIFDDLTNKLDLYAIINQVLEKSGALGTVATVTSVYDIIQNEDSMTLDTTNAKIRIDVVDVDNIYPLSWNNKEVTECAFASTQYYKGKKYIVLSVHIKENDVYKIKNHLFEETNGNLTEKTSNDTLQEFDTKSNIKWFSIFKPLLTNNIFESSPFGISHFANALDKLKMVDLAFDSLQNELKLSKKRIFVRADMFNYDDGTQRLTFDPEDASIYQLPTGATKDDLIQPDVDGLRTGNYIETLNTSLNMLGDSVGFGENHYHFDGTNLSTATAVVSSNSKLFRRKKKLEIGYESAIYDLVKSICYASSLINEAKINDENMAIQFDDSIIEDKEAESIRALREVSNGIISKTEYREKIFGETEKIAKKKIEEVNEETIGIQELFSEAQKEQMEGIESITKEENNGEDKKNS